MLCHCLSQGWIQALEHFILIHTAASCPHVIVVLHDASSGAFMDALKSHETTHAIRLRCIITFLAVERSHERRHTTNHPHEHLTSKEEDNRCSDHLGVVCGENIGHATAAHTTHRPIDRAQVSPCIVLLDMEARLVSVTDNPAKRLLLSALMGTVVSSCDPHTPRIVANLKHNHVQCQKTTHFK